MKKNKAGREINLWDMFWAICLKWRMIIMFALLFAILFGAVSYFKNSKDIATLKYAQENPVTTDNFELSDEERVNVDFYLEYKKLFDQQSQYIEVSPLMKLNSDGFYKGEISWYIDNYYLAEYPVIEKTNNITALTYAYRISLTTKEFGESIVESLGLSDLEKNYAKEYIDCENVYGSRNSVNTLAEEGVLTIAVYGEDAEQCEILLDLVEKTIDDNKSKVASDFGKHDLTIINKGVGCVSDPLLGKYQREQIDELKIHDNFLIEMKKLFVGDELAYIDAYERENTNEAEVSEEVSAVNQMQMRPSISKKWLVLGFVLGVLFALFIIALEYLLNSALRFEDDFEEMFGVKMYGNVVLSKQKKKLFGFVDTWILKIRRRSMHIFEEDKSVEMVAANIRIAVSKNNIHKIYVTGAVTEKEEKTVYDLIAKQLKDTDVIFEWGNPIIYDAESLEKMAASDAVLLLEKAGSSLYDEITEEIQKCQQYGVEILGGVIIA